MTHLSPRHREIVDLVGGKGKTYDQVGHILGISPHTVIQHVRVICDRADLDLRPRAVLARIYWTEIAIPD